MVGIFLMSMLYEGLKVFREYLLQRSLQFQGVALGGVRGIAGSSTASSNNGLRVPLAGEGDSII
uniref:Uncharacterized protein n=1 Tax=Romanomermis culicivorax TaxID=13658 RepID=A0A915K2V0_ROMCU